MSATDTRAVVQQMTDALVGVHIIINTGALAQFHGEPWIDRVKLALSAGRALLAALPEQPAGKKVCDELHQIAIEILAAPQGDSVVGSGLPLDTVRTGEEVASVQTMARKLQDLKTVQAGSLTDAYMIGLHNGLELALCVVEDRDPVYVNCPAAWQARAQLNDVSVPCETAAGDQRQDDHLTAPVQSGASTVREG